MIVGEKEYLGSVFLLEGMLLLFNHLFYDLKIEKIYSYVVKDNTVSLRIQVKRLGFIYSDELPAFPEHMKASDLPIVEIILTPDNYISKKEKLEELINYY